MGISVDEAITELTRIKAEHGGQLPLFFEFAAISSWWEEPVIDIAIGEGDGGTRVLFCAKESNKDEDEDAAEEPVEQPRIMEPETTTATPVEPGLDAKLRDRLGEMWNSGDSQQYAIAECLLMISDNGEDSATLDFMRCCAEELRDSAQSVIDFIKQRKLDIAAQA